MVRSNIELNKQKPSNAHPSNVQAGFTVFPPAADYKERNVVEHLSICNIFMVNKLCWFSDVTLGRFMIIRTYAGI